METYFICCLILLTLFVDVHSETKVVSKGSAVILFSNVTSVSIDNEVKLYNNKDKDDTLIASWTFANERFTMISIISYNIGMDDKRNIWFYNVDENYTGRYSLYNSSRLAIELKVLDNIHIKSENPSSIIVPWIVYVLFAISALFLKIAYAGWRRYLEYRCGKHRAQEDKKDDTVSSKNQQSGKGVVMDFLLNSTFKYAALGPRKRIGLEEKLNKRDEDEGKIRPVQFITKEVRCFGSKRKVEKVSWAGEFESLQHESVSKRFKDSEIVERNPLDDFSNSDRISSLLRPTFEDY